MRPYIEKLDTRAIEWSRPRPGTAAKLLSANEDKQSRTVLLCFDPQKGYEDQLLPHYHEGYEELFILAGQLSFDRKTWLHRGGYVFHPPMTIHGFDSRVAEKTTILARTDGPIETSFISREEVLDDYPYFIGTKPSSRALALVPSPWAFPLRKIESAAGVIKEFVLSADDTAGEVTRLLRFFKGAREAAHEPVSNGMAEEIYVMSGCLVSDDGTEFCEGSFACYPAGTRRPSFTALDETEVQHAILVD